MSVDPKDRPVQCFVPIPTEILINGSQMDVRSMRCPERIPLGELMCSAHWALLDKGSRQAIIHSARYNVKQGYAHYNAEWKRLADAAVKAVFRTLIETKLKEKKDGADLRSSGPAGPDAARSIRDEQKRKAEELFAKGG